MRTLCRAAISWSEPWGSFAIRKWPWCRRHRISSTKTPLRGMSADKCGEVVQQRARWAQGTLQALFASTNPLIVPGLNWKQRLMHFSGIIYYLGSVSTLFNLIAPLLFLFFGTHLLRMTAAEM